MPVGTSESYMGVLKSIRDELKEIGATLKLILEALDGKLESEGGVDGVPDDASGEDKGSGESSLGGRRASPFRFAMAKVIHGEILTFVDDPEKTCTVLDERHVLYEGEPDSLSGLAKKFRGTESERGPECWLYNGETLQARRERFEQQEERDGS